MFRPGRGFRRAGGMDMLFAGSPVHTVTTWLLYTSFFLTISSFLKVICASLSFFFWYSILRRQSEHPMRDTYVGPIRTSTAPLLRCRRCVTSSVLKKHENTGSGSSELDTLMAYERTVSSCTARERTHNPVVAEIRETDTLDRHERHLALERRRRASLDDLEDEDVRRLVRLDV